VVPVLFHDGEEIVMQPLANVGPSTAGVENEIVVKSTKNCSHLRSNCVCILEYLMIFPKIFESFDQVKYY